MNFVLYIFALILVGFVAIFLDYKTTFILYMSRVEYDRDGIESEYGISEGETNFIKRTAYIIHFILVLYLWIIWANLSANAILHFASEEWTKWLYIAIGFFLTLNVMKISRIVKIVKMKESDYPTEIKEYNIISMFLAATFILSLLYKNQIPNAIDWLAEWIY